MQPSRIRKRSVVIDDHKTSISMEAEFWDALIEIRDELSAKIEKRVPLGYIIGKIDRERVNGNLSSAVRLYVLQSLQAELRALNGRG